MASLCSIVRHDHVHPGSDRWGNVQGTCCTNWLKQAEVPILSQATCRKPEILGSQISDSMVCASPLGGGTDTCQVLTFYTFPPLIINTREKCSFLFCLRICP